MMMLGTWVPRITIVLHDMAMVWAAWVGVHWLRYLIDPQGVQLSLLPAELPTVLIAQGVVLFLTGLYRGIWRFASLPDLWNIVRAAALGTALIGLALFLISRLEGIPRSVLLLYPFGLIFLLGAPRLAYRMVKDHGLRFYATPNRQRVLILGAGSAGDMLARDLRRESDEYYPAGFLDDDRTLRGSKIRGVSILGGIDRLSEIVRSHSIDMAIIAMPSATNQQLRTVVEHCEAAGVPFRTIPRLRDVVAGRLNYNDIKDVAIEDLLGRDPVELDWQAIGAGVSGRTAMVTGGGGSIGAELCRQIARLDPARLIVLECNEYNLYSVEAELRRKFSNLVLEVILGDVGDHVLLDRVLSEFQPDIVFHAAAYKQVPLLQTHLREAIRNNVIGTKVVAELADRHSVATFVLISTDKAVNPSSLMGASKRVAEIFCQNFAAQSNTRFVTVRFGNVLDSAGSVVPLFRQQIRDGGPVTVTHPDMSRYFMTIPEACQLIMQTAAMGDDGGIYVLDMGQPVKILYLAEQMIRLAGKEPGRDIEVVYTGLRDGEKLIEELFHENEPYQQTEHPQITQARHRPVNWQQLGESMQQMEAAVRVFDEVGLRQVVNQLIPEFTRQNDENIVSIDQARTK